MKFHLIVFLVLEVQACSLSTYHACQFLHGSATRIFLLYFRIFLPCNVISLNTRYEAVGLCKQCVSSCCTYDVLVTRAVIEG